MRPVGRPERPVALDRCNGLQTGHDGAMRERFDMETARARKGSWANHCPVRRWGTLDSSAGQVRIGHKVLSGRTGTDSRLTSPLDAGGGAEGTLHGGSDRVQLQALGGGSSGAKGLRNRGRVRRASVETMNKPAAIQWDLNGCKGHRGGGGGLFTVSTAGAPAAPFLAALPRCPRQTELG